MFSCPSFVSKRQYGVWPRSQWRDAMYSTLYKSFQVSTCSETTPSQGQDWGAVFGFGFSPDGTLLVAACENNCMLVYDPGNAKRIMCKFHAHDGCVNCVRFLDNRLFVTCSDDSTVRLWDARHLSQELKVLNGHTNWVKNVEYCPVAGKLITSGFDGNILAWDINNYSENEQPEQLLYINGMMRTKICPDEKRMILSTLGGYFILIHDLDLEHLHDDLNGFRPRLYTSMHILGATLYKDMFSRRRNRVEFINDFPHGDDAESISAMEVHPQGWCMVSRNTTSDDQAEWTCVHDVQPLDQPNATKSCRDCSRDVKYPYPNTSQPSVEPGVALSRAAHLAVGSVLQCIMRQTQASEENQNSATPLNNGLQASGNSTQADWISNDSECQKVNQSSGTSSGSNLPSEQCHGGNGSSSSSRHTSINNDRVNSNKNVTLSTNSPSYQNSSSQVQDASMSSCTCKVKPTSIFSRRERRLLFHSEEPNVGHGYIKEQSFSPDGRIIASPFANCVRLLAFDANCHELCDLNTLRPHPLHQVALTAGNRSSVLASTFSPTQLMYVAGAEDGSISFCAPRL